MKDLKKIWNLFKPHSGKLLLVAIFNILSVIFSLFSVAVLAPFLSLIFNQVEFLTEKPQLAFSSESILQIAKYYLGIIVVNHGFFPALLLLLGVVFVAFFCCKFFSYSAIWIYTSIRTTLVGQYREEAYNKILHLPLSYFSSHKKGDIISRVINDVQEIDLSIFEAVQNLLKAPLTVLLYLIALIFINLKLTLFILLFFPIVSFAISRIQRTLKSKAKQSKEQQAEMTGLLEESIYALRIIKAFNAIESMKQKFGNINKNYTHLLIKINRLRDLSSPTGEFLGTFVVVIILLFGSLFVLNPNHSFSAEIFITYIALFTQMINPAKTIAEATANIKRGLASMERIEELLFSKQMEKDHGIESIDFHSTIEFKHVYFSYKNHQVLNDVSFSIAKGQKIAICGPSGAGKTTIVDLLSGFFEINKGEILIDGIDINQFSVKCLRSLLGIVSQESIMFNDSIYNNVTLNTKSTESEILEALKTANAYDFVLETENGLFTNVGDRGNKLSGGQKQRLSIARALLKNAPILIMDEATSALDSKSEKLVQNAIDKLINNKTCIIIAHRLSTIINADNILVIANGKIVEQGTHKQLIAAQGIYNQMVMDQSFE